MFSESILSRSGQLWKFWVAIVLLLVGSIAPLFPESRIDMTGGTVIAIAGYAFGLFAIRCSACRNMWFWEAAKDAGLYKAIFKGDACPACKHSYAASKTERL